MSHAQQQSQPTTTSLLSNMNIPPKQHEMRNNSAPTQQQTKTSTRLEKLIKLLESTDLEKSQAAAVEIGNVFANDQTNILNETLKRLSSLLISVRWNTRLATSQAVEYLSKNHGEYLSKSQQPIKIPLEDLKSPLHQMNSFSFSTEIQKRNLLYKEGVLNLDESSPSAGAKKRKRGNEDDSFLSLPPAKKFKTTTNSDDKPSIDSSNSQQNIWQFWEITQFCLENLFSTNWETRHGSAICLRCILSYQACLLPISLLEHILCDLLLVLFLDRFNDFVGDQTVAPVRGIVAQIFAVLFMAKRTLATNENNKNDFVAVLSQQHFKWLLQNLKQLVAMSGFEADTWMTRYSACLGLKFVIAARMRQTTDVQDDFYLVVEEVVESGLITQLMQDEVDDIRGVTAELLIPVVETMIMESAKQDNAKSDILVQNIKQIVALVWSEFSFSNPNVQFDDISNSTKPMMELLAKLYHYFNVLVKKIEEETTKLGSTKLMFKFEDCFTNLSALTPSLFPFLRHNTKSVRISTLQTIHSLIKNRGAFFFLSTTTFYILETFCLSVLEKNNFQVSETMKWIENFFEKYPLYANASKQNQIACCQNSNSPQSATPSQMAPSAAFGNNNSNNINVNSSFSIVYPCDLLKDKAIIPQKRINALNITELRETVLQEMTILSLFQQLFQNILFEDPEEDYHHLFDENSQNRKKTGVISETLSIIPDLADETWKAFWEYLQNPRLFATEYESLGKLTTISNWKTIFMSIWFCLTSFQWNSWLSLACTAKGEAIQIKNNFWLEIPSVISKSFGSSATNELFLMNFTKSSQESHFIMQSLSSRFIAESFSSSYVSSLDNGTQATQKNALLACLQNFLGSVVFEQMLRLNPAGISGFAAHKSIGSLFLGEIFVSLEKKHKNHQNLEDILKKLFQNSSNASNHDLIFNFLFQYVPTQTTQVSPQIITFLNPIIQNSVFEEVKLNYSQYCEAYTQLKKFLCSNFDPNLVQKREIANELVGGIFEQDLRAEISKANLTIQEIEAKTNNLKVYLSLAEKFQNLFFSYTSKKNEIISDFNFNAIFSFVKFLNLHIKKNSSSDEASSTRQKILDSFANCKPAKQFLLPNTNIPIQTPLETWFQVWIWMIMEQVIKNYQKVGPLKLELGSKCISQICEISFFLLSQESASRLVKGAIESLMKNYPFNSAKEQFNIEKNSEELQENFTRSKNEPKTKKKAAIEGVSKEEVSEEEIELKQKLKEKFPQELFHFGIEKTLRDLIETVTCIFSNLWEKKQQQPSQKPSDSPQVFPSLFQNVPILSDFTFTLYETMTNQLLNPNLSAQQKSDFMGGVSAKVVMGLVLLRIIFSCNSLKNSSQIIAKLTANHLKSALPFVFEMMCVYVEKEVLRFFANGALVSFIDLFPEEAMEILYYKFIPLLYSGVSDPEIEQISENSTLKSKEKDEMCKKLRICVDPVVISRNVAKTFKKVFEGLSLEHSRKFSLIFVVHLLKKMGDPDLITRETCSHTFGHLMKTLPLVLSGLEDQKSSYLKETRDRVFPPKELIDKEARFVEQLLDSRKIFKDNIEEQLHKKVIEQLKSKDFTLRPYQKEGIAWLLFLNRFHLNGILCDDMGLGKTLQALCAILSFQLTLKEKIFSAFAQKHQNNPNPMLQQELLNSLPSSLVIVPETLVGQWKFEIRKFFDEETCSILQFEFSSSKDRNQILSNFKSNHYDFIIVSYKTFSQESAQFIYQSDKNGGKKKTWSYVLLDEGHMIKDPTSKKTQKIKELVSLHRVILSGTPIQNHILEIWSLFDFLIPNLLGKKKEFDQKYGNVINKINQPEKGKRKPIKSKKGKYVDEPQLTTATDLEHGQQNESVLARQQLERQVLPFLLRRTKDQVLTDLPPKIIQDRIVEMNSFQRILHSVYEEGTPEIIPKQLDAIKIQIFQQKTCTHPSLALNSFENKSHKQKILEILHKDYVSQFSQQPQTSQVLSMSSFESHILTTNFSPKLLALEELLKECLGSSRFSSKKKDSNVESEESSENSVVTSQHRCLIFTQFKETIDLIINSLLNSPNHFNGSISFKVMTQDVDPSERADIALQFNNDPTIDCLLLTTKVGSLGLNLQAADVVIFVEHDFLNPANDVQAMDRAHRIGQRKVVNVYRLISANSIEEKKMSLKLFLKHISNTKSTIGNMSMSSLKEEEGLMETLGKSEENEKNLNAESVAGEGTDVSFRKAKLWDDESQYSDLKVENFLENQNQNQQNK